MEIAGVRVPPLVDHANQRPAFGGWGQQTRGRNVGYSTKFAVGSEFEVEIQVTAAKVR